MVLPLEILGFKVYIKKLDIQMAEQILKYVNDERNRLGRFLSWPSYINTIDDEVAFIQNSSDDWENGESADFGIFRIDDNQYLGNVGAFDIDWENDSCEIGYWVIEKFEGKGYVREAVELLQNGLFNIGMNRTVIKCAVENHRSKKIPIALGYSFEGILQDYKQINGVLHSFEVYSKLRVEL